MAEHKFSPEENEALTYAVHTITGPKKWPRIRQFMIDMQYPHRSKADYKMQWHTMTDIISIREEIYKERNKIEQEMQCMRAVADAMRDSLDRFDEECRQRSVKLRSDIGELEDKLKQIL